MWDRNFVPGMQVQVSSSTEGESLTAAVYREAEYRKRLSELAFGRDIAGLGWDALTPAEKRAINELAQTSGLPAWLERFAARIEAHDPPRPEFLVNRGDWTIPAGHQNRKARRAAQAKQRREAWHAFKAGRREGMSSGGGA